MFGKENYFLELMDHGLDIETRVRDGLIEIGRKLGIPPVVTNDSHYSKESDAQAQELLLCIQTGKTLADEDRFKFDGTGYYIKSPAEMYAVNNSDVWARGLPQQPAADRRPGRHGRHVRVRQPDAALPDPGRVRVRGRAVRGTRSGRAWPSATRAAIDETRTQAGRVRDSASSSRWASRPTSWSSPTSSTGRRTTASRSARAAGRRGGQHRRLRDGHHRPRPARPRPDLRAVPQPRAHLDAGHRHRLRRARPGRRHPLRHPALGQRQGRPDHHLRDDQGEGRHQGLDPGPRLPLRPRRPHHQGVPARR